MKGAQGKSWVMERLTKGRNLLKQGNIQKEYLARKKGKNTLLSGARVWSWQAGGQLERRSKVEEKRPCLRGKEEKGNIEIIDGGNTLKAQKKRKSPV